MARRRKFIEKEKDQRIKKKGPRHASSFKKFKSQPGKVVTTLVRKWNSDYSTIELKMGETYKFNSGFRVYPSHTATKANAKGHNPIPIEIKLFEESEIMRSNASRLGWSIILASALTAFTFAF